MSETPSIRRPEAVAIGIDLGGTRIKGGVVALDGEILASFQQDSPRTTSALRDFVETVRRQATSPLVGIGMGCKGVIDTATTRVNCLPGDLNFLEGLLLKDLIGGGGLQVCADNDARSTLLGEVLWGQARGRRNAVLLTLGTGIGGAALVDGVILRGASGAAGHFGHVTFDVRGGLCICGNYGCVETYFSSRAIESEYFAHLHRASPTTLSVDQSGRIPDAESIFRVAGQGDASASRVLQLALEALTASVVSLMHLFDPEVLILGGSMAAAGPQLLAPLEQEVARRTLVLLGRKVPIILQNAGGYGGVAGAAGLVFEQQKLLRI